MSGTVAVVDYGTGNLTSICRAFARVGVSANRVSSPEEASGSSHLVLPGVGAFPKAMEKLGEIGFVDFLREQAEAGTPILGVCLGMQLLFESSTELEGAFGLGIVAGQVVMLDAVDERMPHIGWSPVRWTKDSPLTAGLENPTALYHVHSYAALPTAESAILGKATHGTDFVTAVQQGSVYGVQFHPEKSSDVGLRLLRNFAGIAP